MTILEYIKNVERCCLCNNSLVWWKKEYTEMVRSRGGWRIDYVKLLTDTCKYRIRRRYIAECTICGKFYFATNTKKEMLDGLKFLGFGYSRKLLRVERGGI